MAAGAGEEHEARGSDERAVLEVRKTWVVRP